MDEAGHPVDYWPYSLVVFACLSDCIGQRWPSCAPTCSLGLPYSEHPVLLLVEMSFLVVLVLPCSRWFHHLTLSLARYSPLLVVDVPCYNPWLPCAVSLLGSLRLSAPLIASTFQFAVIVLSFALQSFLQSTAHNFSVSEMQPKLRHE